MIETRHVPRVAPERKHYAAQGRFGWCISAIALLSATSLAAAANTALDVHALAPRPPEQGEIHLALCNASKPDGSMHL